MHTGLISIFYLIISSFSLLSYYKDNKQKQIWLWILIPFYLKLIIGILYGYSFLNNKPIADTWNYHFNGLNILKEIYEGNFNFNRSHSTNNLNSFSSFSESIQYYRYFLMDCLSALFSFLSGGRYYVNLIFYNWIVYLGLIKLFKFVNAINPGYKSVFYWVIFFFPPFVFWTSGFHRDGLCIAALGAALYYFQLILKKYEFKKLIYFVICLFLLLFMRSFWGFSLMIVASIWLFTHHSSNIKPYKVLIIGFLFFGTLFFLSGLLPKGLNFPSYLALKQHAFLSLKGDSRLPLANLENNPISYFKPAMQGLNHLALRPYFPEIPTSYLYLLAFLENLTVWVLLIVSLILFWKKKANFPLKQRENAVLLSLVLINYLIIGLTVPFLGAIVRYKVPFELLLILLLIQVIPSYIWDKYIPKTLRIQENLFNQ